jgi:zinc protease
MSPLLRGSVAFRVPGLSHEDSPALDMLASILGGNESSVLNQSLRMKEGIVSEIDASCWNPGATGLFWISYVCDCGRYGRAESAIEKEISALIAKGIRKADLDKARLLAVSAMIDHHKTVSGQAARIGISEVVIGDLNYPAHYFDALWALTPEDIVKAAEKYLTPAACSVVTMDAPEARKAKASPRPEAPEAFRVITLPGGARIALQEDHALPKVSIRFGALGGPLYEDARTSGASALLATLLTRDTQVRDAGAVSELIEGCGGRMSDFSGNNSFGFAIEVLSGQLPKAIELFGDALLRPRVDANTFRIERESQIALLRENDDDITERGRIHMRRAFFGTHPYREQAEGTVEALEALKVEDIEDMRARLIRSGNAVVSICGDFKADEMVAEIGGILEQLPQSPFAPERPPFAPPPSSFVVEKMQREQAVVFHAFAGPGVLDPLYHASELLDEVLSDMSGPLFVNIRERKGLAYFVRSSRMNGLHAGMFTLMAGTKPDKCPEVRHEFDTALDEIRRTGLPQDVLQRARTRSKAGRRFATQTIGSRANCALLDVLYGQPVMTSHDYDAIIDATGNEQIRALATKYLDESRCLRFTIGPEGTL